MLSSLCFDALLVVPALIVRLTMRRPMKRGWAILFSVCLWPIATIILAVLKAAGLVGVPGAGAAIVSILSYVVLRWGASLSSAKQTTQTSELKSEKKNKEPFPSVPRSPLPMSIEVEKSEPGDPPPSYSPKNRKATGLK